MEPPISRSMAISEPRRGRGAFQWNAGGWFGGQIGSTAWLLILGGLLLPEEALAGTLVFLCGVLPNGIGLLLWSRRVRLDPYAAIQVLLASAGAFALIALLLLDFLGPEPLLDKHFPGMAKPTYAMLLIYPGLMLLFHLQERAVRRSASA
jgi:hypothetical protein